MDESELPPGYHVAWDADAPTLRRADGSMVAAFSATGMDPKEVERLAWADAERDPAARRPWRKGRRARRRARRRTGR